MLIRNFYFVVILLFSGLTNTASADVIRTQNFDSDPSWTTIGNGSNGNNFGYQSSANAGGSTGEGGGRFTRSNFVRTYADTTGISLSLLSAFQASGKFNFTNDNTPDFGPGLLIGHFSGSGVGGIGINFNNNGTGVLHWQAHIKLSDGTELSSNPTQLLSNQARTWDYSWDPNGGILGGGRLSVNFSGTNGGGSQIVDLTPAYQAVGLSVDSFGFNSEAALTSNSSRLADLYIDDLQYSVAVPEISSMLAWTISIILFTVYFYFKK